jgi:translocation and assembly module TamB
VRALAKLLLGTLLAALVASAVIAVALRTPAVRSRIASLLGQLLSDDQRTVTISSLGGMLPFAPTVGVIEIADPGGTWLRIENVAVDVDPLRLFLRHVHVRRASADRVLFSRLPQPDEEPFVLRPIRLLVTAETVQARAIELGPELLGGESGNESSSPIAAEAKGRVDLRRLTLAVELAATTARLDDVLRVLDGETETSTSSAQLTVEAHGAIEAPGGTVKLTVADLRREDLSLATLDIDAVAERLGHGERRYRVAVGVRTTGLKAPEELAAWLGSSPGLSAAARFGPAPAVFDLDALKLETATFGAEMTGHARERGQVDISRVSVTLPDIHSAPGFADAVRGGALRIRGSGVMDTAWTEPKLDATLAAEGIDLDLEDARVGRLVGAAPKLTATVRYAPESGLDVGSIRLVGDGLSLDGSASLAPPGTIHAKAEVEVPDVAGLDVATPSTLSGAVDGTVEFAGTLDAFEAAATARPRAVRFREREPVGGDISITARGDRGNIAGNATARLLYGEHPVQAAARYSYEAARKVVRVEGAEASFPGVEVEANGEFAISPELARGHADIHGRDLSLVGAVFGIDTGGEADVSLDLDHDGARQRARVSAAGRGISVDDLLIDAVKLEVTPVGGGRASRFALDADGTYRHDFTVHAEGTAIGDLANQDFTFERLDGRYEEHPFAARRALKLTLRDGGVSVRDGSLDIASGNVEGAWSAGGLHGTGRIRFANLPLALLSLVNEHAVARGEVSGEAVRETVRDDLEVSVRTANAGLPSASAPSGIERFELDAHARISARRSRIESLLATPEGALRFELAADLPLGIDGSDGRGRLNGRVAGALGAEWIGQVLLPEDDFIDGRLDVALDLGGTLEAPTATGRATGKLSYSSAVTGMNLRIEELDLRAEGQSVRIAALRGSDGRDGVIEGRGGIDFAGGLDDAVYDVEVGFMNMYLARIDEVRLRGDGALQLTGQGASALLKGGFTADKAVLRIPDKLPPEIATIPVEHVNVAMSRNPPRATEEAVPAVPLGLDLALQFPSYLRVEDPNLDSEWRGELFIRGDTAAPDVQGKLKVIRGRFSLGGVQFVASEGSLSFDEESDIPTVDITAVANRNQIEATLRLHGRIDRAEIELRSEPPLPQDEILSRLMFGATTSALTPAQSVQLAQAVARLSGKGAGVDVFGRVGRLVGVDRIEIKDTTDTGTGATTTAVSVGKYLTDRIYVSLDQAVQGEGSKARVEVELTKHIAAETEIGQNQNTLFGLKWRWNY